MGAQSDSKKIAIVGTGYVGMACAVGFAELGHRIVGYDILVERIHQLQAGVTPYREAGIAESLKRHLLAGHITFVDDLAVAAREADFVVVAVGTPSHADGSADIRAVEDVFSKLSELDLSDATIVLRSTVPPGTSERLAEVLPAVDLVFAPEFLREGTAVHDFLSPDRIVIGASTDEAAARYADLFVQIEKPTLVMSLRDAELAKVMSNAFLAMKVSFANEVANLCDDLKANALDVLSAVGMDRRIGRLFLQPGIGFGGPCFEKDLKSLLHTSKGVNGESPLLAATLHVNDRQPRRIVKAVTDELGGSVAGLVIGVWGLAFKAGTDDIRDSLALRIVQELTENGAEVVAYDPAVDSAKVMDLPCRLAPSALEAAECDALLVLTEWPEFKNVDPWAIARRVRQRVVVDGRNVLDIEALTAAGLRYRGVGRRRDAETVEQLAEAG